MKKLGRIVLYIIGGIVVVFVLLVAIGLVIGGGKSSPPVVVGEPTNIAQAVTSVKVTATPKDTAVPRPTNSPRPTNTPAPTRTLTPVPVGLDKAHAWPFGTPATAGKAVVAVNKMTRPATDQIKQANMFNPDPGTGQEYVVIPVAVGFVGKAEETFLVNPFDFHLAGDLQKLYAPQLVAGLPDLLQSATLLGGGQAKGYLVFLIDHADARLALQYSPGWFTAPVWVAAE